MAADLSVRQFMLAVAAACCLGFLLRAMFVFSGDFPLNDGGMFYAMVRDLQANGYRLPATTSYNGGGLPFAYPPLGFYLAGVLDELGVPLIDVLRFLPLMVSTFSVAAFAPLALEVLPTRRAAAMALVPFALLVAGFDFLIMGGGLTRAPGFVFALLAIGQAARMYRTGSWWSAIAAALCGALSLLSHIEMALLACISIGMLFAAYGRSRRGIAQSACVAAATVVLSAPWWLTVVARDGLAPFVASAHSTDSAWWGPLVSGLKFNVSLEGLFPLIGALAALGLLTSLVRRRYLLPAWLGALAVFDQRAFVTSAVPVVALLAAVAVDSVIVPLVRGADAAEGGISGTHTDARTAPGWMLPAVLIALVVYPVLSVVASPSGALVSLSPGERAAMAWAGEHTPASARFVVVDGLPWPSDASSEWFPVLAGRTSIATVQGSEWTGAFDVKRVQSKTLQACATQEAGCLALWAQQTGADFAYVFVPKLPPGRTSAPDALTCCDPLIASLRGDAAYRVVYDTGAATIFERVR